MSDWGVLRSGAEEEWRDGWPDESKQTSDGKREQGAGGAQILAGAPRGKGEQARMLRQAFCDEQAFCEKRLRFYEKEGKREWSA